MFPIHLDQNDLLRVHTYVTYCHTDSVCLWVGTSTLSQFHIGLLIVLCDIVFDQESTASIYWRKYPLRCVIITDNY